MDGNERRGDEVMVEPEGLPLSGYPPAFSRTACPTLRPMGRITEQWLGWALPHEIGEHHENF